MKTLVFGHRNPDTDSVTSALAVSWLKNKQGIPSEARILGAINRETEFVLDYFGVDKPQRLKDVHIQIKDLNYDKVRPVNSMDSVLFAYRYMESNKIRTLPIVDEEGVLKGVVTMKDIAMSLIKGNYYRLRTSMTNLVKDMDITILNQADEEIEGLIHVMAFLSETIKNEEVIDEKSIVIVGDRYDIIEFAIESGVKLIVITGGKCIPSELLTKAVEQQVNIVSTPYDTYITSKLINQLNTLSEIMKDTNIVAFQEEEYLSTLKEAIRHNPHSNYPVVNERFEYRGFINRKHILNPGKKNVILVDHNEYGQSAEGLKDANIIEIIDHHKLGDIHTKNPILFRNMPVGSTCTLIYSMYKESGLQMPNTIAGLLMAGIISDTLFLSSPTTTEMDCLVLDELQQLLDIDSQAFAMEMFKVGTRLEGKNVRDIFSSDFKEFNIEGNRIGISQIYTLDIDDVFKRRDDFITYIQKVANDKNHYLTLMLITDIINEGSYLLFETKNDKLLDAAFDCQVKQGTYIDEMVSRKKQVIPKLVDGFNMLK